MFDSARFTDQILRGSIIVKKGDVVKNIFHLKKGEIDVLKTPPGIDLLKPNEIQEKAVPISKITKGKTFLEMEALTGRKSPYYYRAGSMCTISRLGTDEDELQLYLDTNFDLTLQIVQNLALAAHDILRKVSHAQLGENRLKNAYKSYCQEFFRTIQHISQTPRPPEIENVIRRLLNVGMRMDIYQSGQKFEYERAQEYWQTKFSSMAHISYTPTADVSKNIRVFEAGEFLFKEGDMGNSMYIVLKGEMEGLINNEVEFEINDPGTVVGEMGLLLTLNDKEIPRRSASIRCRTQCQVLEINNVDFIPFMKAKREILFDLVFTLKDRYQSGIVFLHEHKEKIKKMVGLLIPGARKNYKEINDFISGNLRGNHPFQEITKFFEERLRKIEIDLKIFKKLYLDSKDLTL
ncbi:cyclic nucleotide-binding domain-containing protein [Candidatus Riflebacteria bacterium]